MPSPANTRASSTEEGRVSSARLSLVVPTVNRTAELARLFESLVGQEFKDFEILVVDQNSDDRIVPTLKRYHPQLNIVRILIPARHGISSARNDGWRRASGDVVLFPDDDCWYPAWFLRKGLEVLDRSGADLVSGRFADESGRSINGRFAPRAQFITRRSVWITQSESASFYRRDLLESVGGFDESLGIGSSSHWQAAEGPDLILRALQHQRTCYYDPSLYGFHREYDLDDPSGSMVIKGRLYARGMGYVLRRHRHGALSLLYWAVRPLATATGAIIKGKRHRAAFSLSVSIGRVEGWIGRVSTVGTQCDIGNRDAETLSSNSSAANVDHNASFGTKRREMTGPYRARNPLLVGALYIIDAVAGLLPQRRTAIEGNRPLRVLVANWGHLGDVVTILPLLRFLARQPRVQEIGVLIGSWSAAVLEASDIEARIHVIDHWVLDRRDKSTLRKFVDYVTRRSFLIDELSRCRYDISIDTFSSFPSSHGITWSSSIPCRIGYTSGGLGPCLTIPFDWVADDRSMLDHQLALLKPLFGASTPQSLPASYSGFDHIPAERPPGIGGAPYIVVHMGPQNIRGWIPEKWTVLAAALKVQGYDLVATGGPGREMDAARILSEKVTVKDLTGRLSWKQFVATIANASAVVTIDSVAGHVAACFEVPTVVLAAGRQRLSLWHPNNSRAVMLTHSVACAPCNRSNGCAAMACIRLVDVDDVLSSLQQVMQMKRSEPPAYARLV